MQTEVATPEIVRSDTDSKEKKAFPDPDPTVKVCPETSRTAHSPSDFKSTRVYSRRFSITHHKEKVCGLYMIGDV